MPSSLRTTRTRRRGPHHQAVLAAPPPSSPGGWCNTLLELVLDALTVLALLEAWMNLQWTTVGQLARAYQFEAYVASRAASRPRAHGIAELRPPRTPGRAARLGFLTCLL